MKPISYKWSFPAFCRSGIAGWWGYNYSGNILPIFLYNAITLTSFSSVGYLSFSMPQLYIIDRLMVNISGHNWIIIFPMRSCPVDLLCLSLFISIKLRKRKAVTATILQPPNATDAVTATTPAVAIDYRNRHGNHPSVSVEASFL